ncbi:hypothetical protein FD725_15460 [Nostoc sp. TCL26-01]|nr:hypothetical protein FD725_15460 [Nostoc sp. TCL26-01]
MCHNKHYRHLIVNRWFGYLGRSCKAISTFEKKEFFSNSKEKTCNNLLNSPSPLITPSPSKSPSSFKLFSDIPLTSQTSLCSEREIPNYHILESVRVLVSLVIIVIIIGILNLVINGILSAILKNSSLEYSWRVCAMFAIFLGLVIGWQGHHIFL